MVAIYDSYYFMKFYFPIFHGLFRTQNNLRFIKVASIQGRKENTIMNHISVYNLMLHVST